MVSRQFLLTLCIEKSDSQHLWFGFFICKVSMCIPHPGPVATCIGLQLHQRHNYRIRCRSVIYHSTKNYNMCVWFPSCVTLTVVVGTDFESAISSHEKADGTSLFVPKEFDITCSTLLPLWGVILTGKTVQLCPPTQKKSSIFVA